MWWFCTNYANTAKTAASMPSSIEFLEFFPHSQCVVVLVATTRITHRPLATRALPYSSSREVETARFVLMADHYSSVTNATNADRGMRDTHEDEH